MLVFAGAAVTVASGQLALAAIGGKGAGLASAALVSDGDEAATGASIRAETAIQHGLIDSLRAG